MARTGYFNPKLYIDWLDTRERLIDAGCFEIVTAETYDGGPTLPDGLTRAVELAGGYGTLVVPSLKDISTNPTHVADAVALIEAEQVFFYAIDERLSSEDFERGALPRLIFTIANMQREYFGRSVSAGMAVARNEGTRIGRPRRLSDADLTYAADVLSDPYVTVAEIAYELGVSTSTLFRAAGGGRASLIARYG